MAGASFVPGMQPAFEATSDAVAREVFIAAGNDDRMDRRRCSVVVGHQLLAIWHGGLATRQVATAGRWGVCVACCDAALWQWAAWGLSATNGAMA